MNGAGKYYYPMSMCHSDLGFEEIEHNQYYGNHIVFDFGEHARGKTLEIYLIENENELKAKGLYHTKRVEVYGMVCGQRGWTECYGWKIQGKWVDFCNDILEKAVQLHKEKCENFARMQKENEENKKKEEREFAKTFDKYF